MSEAWPSEGAPAEVETAPETMLSAIDAISIVHQVRSADGANPQGETIREVIAAMCPGEEPDWRALHSDAGVAGLACAGAGAARCAIHECGGASDAVGFLPPPGG